MTTSAPVIELVDCAPYSCRLTARACAMRQARAAIDITEPMVARCRDCECGRAICAAAGLSIDALAEDAKAENERYRKAKKSAAIFSHAARRTAKALRALDADPTEAPIGNVERIAQRRRISATETRLVPPQRVISEPVSENRSTRQYASATAMSDPWLTSTQEVSMEKKNSDSRPKCARCSVMLRPKRGKAPPQADPKLCMKCDCERLGVQKSTYYRMAAGASAPKAKKKGLAGLTHPRPARREKMLSAPRRMPMRPVAVDELHGVSMADALEAISLVNRIGLDVARGLAARMAP